MDLVGPLPTSTTGECWIFTAVDVLSSYVVLRSATSKTMEEIARILWSLMCEYGTMKILQSDNSSEFVNQVIRSLTTLYGVDHRLITPYHVRADGLMENCNKHIGRALKKLMAGSTGYWPDWLPAIQLALNTTMSERHKPSAFALVFGRSFNDWMTCKKQLIVV